MEIDHNKIKIATAISSALNDKRIRFPLKVVKNVTGILSSLLGENLVMKRMNDTIRSIDVSLIDLDGEVDNYMYEKFDPQGWSDSEILQQFKEFIPQITLDCKKITISRSRNEQSFSSSKTGGDSVTFYELDNGLVFMEKKEPSEGAIDKFYAPYEIIEKVEDFMLKRVWNLFTENSIQIKSSSSTFKSLSDMNRRGLSHSEQTITIKADDHIDRCESINSINEANTLKKYYDAGKKRSIMYYGPPGTGKSTIANEVARKIGKKTIRFFIDDIQEGRVDIARISRVFQPEIIIIDDIDRINLQESLVFELIEFLRKNCQLLIFTCNKLNFDPALIRPGRIDQCVPITKLDDKVITDLLGEDLKDAYYKVKDWPIAYIHELRERVDVVGVDEAIESISDIISRVNEMKKLYPGDDNI